MRRRWPKAGEAIPSPRGKEIGPWVGDAPVLAQAPVNDADFHHPARVAPASDGHEELKSRSDVLHLREGRRELLEAVLAVTEDDQVIPVGGEAFGEGLAGPRTPDLV
jgi:hypothetical protein